MLSFAVLMTEFQIEVRHKFLQFKAARETNLYEIKEAIRSSSKRGQRHCIDQGLTS
jgi:hypothetical protein